MDRMNFLTTADDPRLCTAAAVGTCSQNPASVTSVVVALVRRRGDVEAAAIHLLTPAEAREMAMELWNCAEKADRTMNAAVTVEGKEGN